MGFLTIFSAEKECFVGISYELLIDEVFGISDRQYTELAVIFFDSIFVLNLSFLGLQWNIIRHNFYEDYNVIWRVTFKTFPKSQSIYGQTLN